MTSDDEERFFGLGRMSSEVGSDFYVLAISWRRSDKQLGGTTCPTTQQRSGQKKSANKRRLGSEQVRPNAFIAAAQPPKAQRSAMRAIKG